MHKVTITIQVTSEEALIIADCLEAGNDTDDFEPSLTVEQLVNAMRVAVTEGDDAHTEYASKAFKALA